MNPLSFIIEQNGTEFHTWCPELPGCHAHGKTVKQAIENLKEAVQLYLEVLIEEEIAILAAKHGISEMTLAAKTNTDVFKPTQKDLSIDQMIKLQKYKGIDAETFETLTRELDIPEPLDELLKSL